MTAKKQWLCVEVSCGAEAAEEMASAVAEAFGVSVEVTERSIRFYLEGGYLSESNERKLRQVLNEVQETLYPQACTAFVSSPLTDEGWEDRWKVFFKPLRVGRHWLVSPTWEQPQPETDDRIIWLNPGRAFGTGHHETTRLCLEWLETWAADQAQISFRSMLDVGTGSGILAMAGAMLGLEPVLGVDNDPEAIEVAAENLTINGLDGRVQLLEGSAHDVTDRFDVVMANIQALPLIEMAPMMVERLKPSGALVLSGILVEQQSEVQAAYEQRGLTLRDVKTAAEWCLLAFA